MKILKIGLCPLVDWKISCLCEKILFLVSSGELSLNPDEVIWAHPEVSCKSPAYVITHLVLALEDLAERGCGDPEILGKLVLGEIERLKPLFDEKIAECSNVDLVSFIHESASLMIIDNLDVISVSILPGKADSELCVDPYRELPLPVALQLLKPVAWRDPQIGNGFRFVYGNEFMQGPSCYLGRKPPRGISLIDQLAFLVFERLYHFQPNQIINHWLTIVNEVEEEVA